MVGPEAGEARQACAVQGRRNSRLMTAGLEGDPSAWRDVGQPVELRRVFDVVHLRDNMLAGTAALEVNADGSIQVFLAGVEAEREAPDPAHNEVVLGRLRQSNGQLRLPHGQAEFSRIRDQLDHDIGMQTMHCRKAWGQDVRGHRFGAGHADDTRQALIPSTDRPLERLRVVLETLGLLPDIVACKRQHVTVGRAVEQSHAEVCFERRQPAPDRRLRHAEVLRRRRQVPVSRDGEEEADVVPIEHRDLSYIQA